MLTVFLSNYLYMSSFYKLSCCYNHDNLVYLLHYKNIFDTTNHLCGWVYIVIARLN